MAKRRKTATRTTTKIVRMPAPRAAAPIVVKTTAAPVKRRRSGGRRRSVGGGGRTLNGKTVGGVVIGGALLGWLEKTYGAKLPSVPFVGTKGTIAIAAYFANKHGFMREITADICIAAGATAGYQLGREGKISGELEGDDVYGEVVPQVGVAAQV